MNMIKAPLTLAIAAGLVSNASAEEPSRMETSTPATMEEITVVGELSNNSALKSATPIMENARSVSVETEAMMIEKGVLSVDQAFTYTAGVIGQTFGYATRGDWVKVRGLDVPQYQDSLQSLFGNYNNTRPDVYTLEQVEILKGPASVLYGKGSPGGLVNLVSKRPQEESSHEIIAEAGNFNRKQLALDSTGKIDSDANWLYRVVGVYRDTDTQVDEVEDNTVVFAPSLSWRPTDETNLSLLLNYTETESDTAAQFLPIAGTLYPAPNGKTIDNSTYLGDPDFNQYDAKTQSITFLADHQINDQWRVELNSRWTDAEVDYQQAWPAFIGGDRYVYNADGSLYKDGTVPRSWFRQDATSEQAALDLRLRGEFSTGEVEHEVLIGAQYQSVTLGSAGYYAYALGYDFATAGPDTTFGDAFWVNVFDPVYGNAPDQALLEEMLYSEDPETQSKDQGVYVSDHMTLGRNHVTLGVRYDDTSTDIASQSQDDDAISYSIGYLYETSFGASPYVSFATSFEPVIGNNGAVNPQPLKPQEGEQFEVGVKYQPDNFPGLITLAYFDIEQSNLPDPNNLPGEFEQQRGVTRIDGVELEALAHFGDFHAELNLSTLNTEDPNGFSLASVPDDQASFWLGYGTGEGFKAGAGVRYVGESYGGLDTIKTPSYTLVDMMLGYTLQQWDFQLNVQNAADKDYQATCLSRQDCFAGNARTIVGRLSYQF